MLSRRIRWSWLLLAFLCAGGAAPVAAKARARHGMVRVQGRSIVDGGGPFLGLGATYFTALLDERTDRPRLERELSFLSRQGFNYIRILSMVAWDGREIAPVAFRNREEKEIPAWPDYWQTLRDLIDTAWRHGLRTEITIFADAQTVVPDKADRLKHMDRILADVLPGREEEVILLEVANEGWQNGFPGAQGLSDMREFAAYLARRTPVPVAVSSNHVDAFETVYRGSAADIATWHFSRDTGPNQGWEPVYGCWALGNLSGFPPVSSNEPIGPGSSVRSQDDPVHLVMAAAFAWTAGLPMYVYHSGVGVRGVGDYAALPGITAFRSILKILPADLPGWERNNGLEARAPFTVFCGGQADRYWTDGSEATDGCVRNIGARRGKEFLCVPIGIQKDGLRLKAREAMRLTVYDPLTGKVVRRADIKAGETLTLPVGPGAWILKGTTLPG